MEEEINIKIIMKNKGNLLANATVMVLTNKYGWVTIKGFQIWVSPLMNERLHEKINIQPPSSRGKFGRYISIAYFEEQGQWEIVERKIYEAYKTELNNVDINIPEDIPF